MEILTTLTMLMSLHQAGMETHIKKLGAYEWRVREKHHAILSDHFDKEFVWDFHLGYFARSRGDPEIHGRLRNLTKDMRLERVNTLYPWISSLPKDWPNRDWIIKKYLDKARDWVSGSKENDWVDYRLATELWIKDQAWWPSRKRHIQRIMLKNDLYWRKHGKYP